MCKSLFFFFKECNGQLCTLLTAINANQWLFNMHLCMLVVYCYIRYPYLLVLQSFPTSSLKMGKLETSHHLLQCTSFPAPFHFVDLLPIILLKNKFLWTGNILSKGYPALWYLKYYAFLLICHCAGQLSACERVCNAFGQPGRVPRIPLQWPTPSDKPAPSDFLKISLSSVLSCSRRTAVQRDETQRGFPSSAGYQEHILSNLSW